MKYLSFVVSSLVVAVLVSSRAAVSLPAEALEQDSEAPSSEATGNSLYADLQIVTNRCPQGMALIQGNWCPVQEHVCLEWVDVHGVARKEAIPGPGETGRCGTWKSPTRCLSDTLKPMSFCIDVFEYPNIVGQIPESWMSWHTAKAACEAEGKRLCLRSEWEFAAEGPNAHPYPFGDGFHRYPKLCNFDNSVLKFDRFKDTRQLRVYDQLLVPADPNSECHSDFGVFNMSGNIDEEVVNESGKPYKSDLVGGHVLGVRCNSFASTPGHNEDFSWFEVGTRCCLDTK